MKKASIWSFKLNTAALVLIPAAVGINYIGKLFAELLKLPLWLDAIGTVLAALLGGPIVGALCGAINNIIYGLTLNPVSFAYALSSVGIGLVVGSFSRLGKAKSVKDMAIISLAVVAVSVIVSTPINMIFWGGQTANVWGDAAYAILVAQNIPAFIASAVDELLVDIPDKFATVFISYAIFKGLPKGIVLMYNNDSEVEELD